MLVFVRVGKLKLIQMLPWMTRISRMGRPTDWKVNSRMRMTKATDSTLIITLSRAKEVDWSRSLVELPTRKISSAS